MSYIKRESELMMRVEINKESRSIHFFFQGKNLLSLIKKRLREKKERERATDRASECI